MNEYETTGLRDHRTTDDVSARYSQPPSPGYGVPGWSVVSSPACAEATAGRQTSNASTLHPVGYLRHKDSLAKILLSHRVKRFNASAGFTLAELLVSVGVLVLFVLLVTQLLNSAATVTTLGNKQMDADSQAREVFDRMAIDFAHMLRRPDVDYYVKSNPSPTASPTGLRQVLQSLDDPTRPDPNDQIAFYSTVPGYYATAPAPTPSYTDRNPLSIVAYRVYYPTPPPAGNNPEFLNINKLQRMGKGLAWNGFSSGSNWFPVAFMPIPLASAIPTPEMPSPAPNPTPGPIYSAAGSNISGWCSPIVSAAGVVGEVIGQGVFRFEYYYLLKGQVVNGTTYNPVFSDTPWDTRIPGHIGVAGMQDVAAVVVDIAVIDPRSKVLLPDNFSFPAFPDIRGVALQLIDWGKTSCVGCPSTTQWQTTPGLLRAQWQSTLNGIINGTIQVNGKILPRPAIQGIRVYERHFYLSPRT